MKTVLLFIFSLNFLCSKAQVAENFDDGDFSNNPVWTGDAGNFTVNADLQLQLNATSAGQSQLSTSVSPYFQHSVEWSFYIKQDFAPSTSNYSRVYLASDRPDLTNVLHGFYVQFGESLSNDAIELFRQDSLASTSICRGTNGMIAAAFEVHVRIVRDSVGNWKMFCDYSGGNNFQIDGTGYDASNCTNLYSGIYCVYTSGNINKFYYDDFYFGPEILDTICPAVSNLIVESDSVLEIQFSESVDETTVLTAGNFEVDNGIGNPAIITHDSISNQYKLFFANRFLGSINYNLNIHSVKDLSQNVIQPLSIPFNFTPKGIAKEKDVVITEIYFAPSTSSPLPYAEYVEIYNRKDSAIELRNWIISDGNTDGQINSFTIAPHQFAILTDESDASLFSNFNNVIPVNDFPSLNNDGDEIKIFDNNNILIDELKFDVSIYHSSSKDDGGWSAERIDADFVCGNSANWLASASSFHGTPGSVNSIAGTFSDNESPYIVNAFLEDSITLIILFNEPVSDDAMDPHNYRITNEDGTQILPDAILVNADTAILTFSSAIPHKIFTIQISENVHDCPGNAFNTFHSIRFGYAEDAFSNDIILNELLYYSYDGSNDFVEIYNNSSKVIDLKDWFITETAFADETDIKESAKISNEHKLIFPGEYLVLTEDERKLKTFYTCNDPFAFVNIKSMPDFNSDEGNVVLNDNKGNVISDFSYSDDMQFPILKETRGVSLERISFSNNENNWHSAAGGAGFATPGYANSQSFGYALGGDAMSVSAEVFSPDGDGYSDVLAIHYRNEQPGTVLSLNAYNINGTPVRTIVDHQSMSSEGEVYWDGLSDLHEQLPSAVYVLLGESYDLEGNRKLFKKAVFLTLIGN